ncbi:fimbrillin family protein [Bacteroides sp. 14(A)]|uniref:fimbrillin family protein n=1 Tax=Bacteroides sp. 14(A) TaxID=1163670 RepID=UPI0004785A18|nr:fimbrillin family protein [Bacteroides sp. 14(A)]
MKAIYRTIAFATLALGVVACTQEDDLMTSYQSDPNAVRITAQVGTDEVTGGFTRSNPLGDETEQTTFNVNDQISVTAGTQAAVTYTLAEDETTWNPQTGTYLKWETETMDVTAYYPVTDGTSETTFTVPDDQSEAIEKADYMTYSGTATKGTDGSINLTMQRKMVRIVVDEITFNEQFATGYAVTAVTVHGNTNGYANGEVQTDNIAVIAYKHTDGKFYALLTPTTEDAESDFLTLTVTNSSDADESYTLTVKCIPATIAGNSYSLSLTVGKDVASVAKVEVNEWTESIITGGEAEEVFYHTIENTIATLTIPTDADKDIFRNSVSAIVATTGLTDIVVEGTLTTELQNILAEALASYSGTLYLSLADMTSTDFTEDLPKTVTMAGSETGYYTVTSSDVTTYYVFNADGLSGWNTATKNNSAANLTLIADIDMSDATTWTPIAGYTGTIDGNNKTIKNITFSDNGESNNSRYVGFVYSNQNGSVMKDLTFESPKIQIPTTTDVLYVGLIASNSGLMTNVHIVGETEWTVKYESSWLTNLYLAPLAGINEGSISNCSVSDDFKLNIYDCITGGCVGGVVAYNNGTVTGCISGAELNENARFETDRAVGGIAGWHTSDSNAAIYGCAYYGDLTVNVTTCDRYNAVGGVVGVDLNYNLGIIGCYSTGEIQVSGTAASTGAIAGCTKEVENENSYADYVKSCYWGGSNALTQPIGDYTYTDDDDVTCYMVDGTDVTWNDAKTAMNDALSNASAGWQYTTEGATDKLPLVPVSTATE